MGNVFAKTATDAKSDTPPLIPASDLLATKKSDTAGRGHLSNPGAFNELHREYSELLPASFVGCKLFLSRRLSKHSQLCHLMHIGNDEESSTYRLLATYGVSTQDTLSEAYPMVMGEIDEKGSVIATIVQHLKPHLRYKFFTQLQRGQEVVGQLTTDYCGDSFTASLTIANPNLSEKSALLVGQYLQAITEGLSLGAEIAYHYGPRVCDRQAFEVSACGRYTCGNSVWSGTISKSGTQVCFYHKFNEQFKVGVEFETNSIGNTLALTCYQVNIPNLDFTFCGSIDSGWNLCGVIEKRLQPLPFALVLSGRLNRSISYFRFGLGVNFGSNNI